MKLKDDKDKIVIINEPGVEATVQYDLYVSDRTRYFKRCIAKFHCDDIPVRTEISIAYDGQVYVKKMFQSAYITWVYASLHYMHKNLDIIDRRVLIEKTGNGI